MLNAVLMGKKNDFSDFDELCNGQRTKPVYFYNYTLLGLPTDGE